MSFVYLQVWSHYPQPRKHSQCLKTEGSPAATTWPEDEREELSSLELWSYSTLLGS